MQPNRVQRKIPLRHAYAHRLDSMNREFKIKAKKKFYSCFMKLNTRVDRSLST